MPSLFAVGAYDLVGYSVGCVEYGRELPQFDRIQDGDSIIGIETRSLQCAGIEIVYDTMKELKLNYKDKAPFSKDGLSYGKF